MNKLSGDIGCIFRHQEPDGSGNIGPNLTDAYWVYGNKPMDIYATIRDGRPGGMLAHKDQGPLFIQRATAYVLSIMNTNLPGKPPEANARKQ